MGNGSTQGTADREYERCVGIRIITQESKATMTVRVRRHQAQFKSGQFTQPVANASVPG